MIEQTPIRHITPSLDVFLSLAFAGFFFKHRRGLLLLFAVVFQAMETLSQRKMLNALPASTTIISRESNACNIINILARWVSGRVSVGPKAVVVVKARKR